MATQMCDQARSTVVVVADEKSDDFNPSDDYLVSFAEPFDRDNPQDWTSKSKRAVTGVLSTTGFNRIMVSTIMAPALSTIASQLDMTSVESRMALSVYLLVTAFGPLLVGPLSEVYGRQPVLHATNIWFLIWNIVCGFAQTKGTLITARLMAGFGASAIYALGGGVLGDVWRSEERGRSLGLYLLVPLLGAAVGPIIGGFITEYSTWRWMFWSTSIIQALMVALSFWLFRETHPPTILQNKAKDLRRTTGDDRYQTVFERLDAGRSMSWVLQRALTRPVRLLLHHPIIQFQACLSGFSYGITYLVLSTFADLWTQQYHQSLTMSGLHYIALCLGEVLGAELCGPLLDLVYRRLSRRRNGSPLPEYRIPVMIPGAVLAPIGFLIYGWAAQKHMHWIIVDIGAALLSFGMQIAGQALQAYVIDSCPDHTSSASAATQFFRSLTAFSFPLFAPMMYSALGYGWGNTMLGIAAVVIGIPMPLYLWFYGPKLRARGLSSY